jgi:ABC-type antimicrobial peptide transport system permease subunit
MSRSQRIARDVFTSLLANKQRAFLMMLGVAAGVAVLTAVIAIGQGTRERVMELVQVHNLDMIMVRAGGEVQIFAPQQDRGLAALTEPDARAIEAEISDIGKVSVVQAQRGINLVYQDRSAVTRVFGVDSGFSEIRYRPVSQGEFITDADVVSMARVAVLGDKVAKALFPEGDAVGKVIRVENDPYTVKGVFREIGQTANGEEDQDDRLVIPFSTSSRRLLNRPISSRSSSMCRTSITSPRSRSACVRC